LKEKKMTKLNQIIALDKGVRANLERVVTNAYHQLQKTEAFTGLAKYYEPLVEEEFVYPPDNKKVTAKAPAIITDLQAAWERLFDLTLTKDSTNQQAKADIMVGGVTLATDVPVSTLIWLEKRLVDVKTVLAKMPVTDVAKDWSWDSDHQVWRSTQVKTLRQKKLDEYITVAPATDKHAAQVVKATKDVPEGHWFTTELSGALSPQQRDVYLAKVAQLTEAVKTAREQANMTEVTDRTMGNSILSFVFGG